MYQVVKRDGKIAEFNIEKISAAITKAFDAQGRQYHPSVMDMLALRVTADFEPKIKDGLIAVEDIQDSAERVLSEAGYADVAKAYILYRKQREKVRNVGSALLNYKDLVDNYLQINDWRVKENSTVTYSVGGLILSNSGAITANYWLSEIYDQEVAEAHRSAALRLKRLGDRGCDLADIEFGDLAVSLYDLVHVSSSHRRADGNPAGISRLYNIAQPSCACQASKTRYCVANQKSGTTYRSM